MTGAPWLPPHHSRTSAKTSFGKDRWVNGRIPGQGRGLAGRTKSRVALSQWESAPTQGAEHPRKAPPLSPFIPGPDGTDHIWLLQYLFGLRGSSLPFILFTVF